MCVVSCPRHVTSVLVLKKESIRSMWRVFRECTVIVRAEGWVWLSEVKGRKAWNRDEPAQVGSKWS